MTKFTFFWKSYHPFSNWYKSPFVHNNIEFNCSEQYMMYYKALMFGDIEVAALIMEQTDPYKQKVLGREIRGFNREKWLNECVDIMVPGLLSKFRQNDKIRKILLDTGDTIIAEASPVDAIWGIGLAADNPLALDQATWKGTNLLGITLMKVRDILNSENEI